MSNALLRRFGVVVGCAVLVAVAVVLALRSDIGRQYAGGAAARLTMGDSPTNILFIANNARDVAANNPLGLGTAAGQADVILLARIDPVAHAIYAITIPRDALVAQPHFKNTVPKIKTLFFMGDQETPPRGPKYLEKAVSDLTGLPIEGYLAANFAGFKGAVDLVGGLTVDVKARIFDPTYSGADFRPGPQHMNGSQALAFIRVRQNQAGNSYRVNDYQRMQAEVEVLGLLRAKLLDPATVTTLLPPFVARIKKDVATDLPQDRLVRIGIAMSGAPVYQVSLGSVADAMTLAPVDVAGINEEGRIDEAEYVVLDPHEVQQQLAQFGARPSSTGLPPIPSPTSLHIRLYGSTHMALHLEHLGFRHVNRAGGATGASEVIYPARHPEWGWAAARAMGLGNAYVKPGEVSDVIIYE